MDAINRGAIHRCYIKPRDIKVLRDNILDAVCRYWLLHEIPLEQRATEVREDHHIEEA